MAAKPAGKKSATKPAPSAGPRLKIITVGLPPELIAEVDAIARAETRSRTQQITVFISRGIREYQRMQSEQAAE
jgi:metal-responsive CopG/Arc/MetJ family transcriptional regulator